MKSVHATQQAIESPSWWESILEYFSEADFMPHGHCYLWKPGLVSVHVISDLMIGTAYVAISITLYWLIKKINLGFNRIVLSFGVFIGACGWTHFNEIWNLWYSDYWYSGGVKALTALASVGTGVYLWKLRHPIVTVAEAAKLSEQRRLDLEALTGDLEKRIADRTEALARSEAQLSLITNSLPVLIAYIDEAERYRYANATYQDWFGLSPKELIGKTIKEFVGEGVYGNIRPFVKKALSGEKLTYQSSLNVKGKQIIIEGTYVPDIDEHSRVRGYVALVEDITEKKKADEEREKLVLQLQEAVRARDEFLSIASHELKTPLTALTLQIQTVKRSALKGNTTVYEKERVDKLIDQNERNLKRLARLVDDMLDISRIRTGKITVEKETLDLCKLISDVIDRMADQFGNAGVHVKIIQCDEAIGVWDKFRIEQVLINLLTNGIKYAGSKPLEIKVTKKDKSVVVSIRDQGPGIAKENQQRIFNRFERAISANEVSGLGLGLYIASEIVKAHEGKIWVESELGLGATFLFELPT